MELTSFFEKKILSMDRRSKDFDLFTKRPGKAATACFYHVVLLNFLLIW